MNRQRQEIKQQKEKKNTTRKTFYEKTMHTDSYFRNHRYFTQQKIHTEEDLNQLNKQFVDLPPPLGIENTYQYLRRINKEKLPDLTPNGSLKKKERCKNQSLFVSKQEFTTVPSSSNNSPNKIKLFYSHTLSQTKVPIKFILFQHSNIDKTKQLVELNVMKYLSGCFLKTSLNLQDITLEQYRILEEFIPGTLKFSQKELSPYIPRSILGIEKMTCSQNLFSKIQQFKASNKISQIYQLLKYFILPPPQVMTYQLEFLLSQLNQLIQSKFQNIVHPNYRHIYHLNGKNIKNLFEIDSKQNTLLTSQNFFPPEQFFQFQNTITFQIRKKQHIRRMQQFKNSINRDFTKYSPVSKFLQSETNQIVNSIFQKRKKTFTRVKYKDLIDSHKRPFIQKSKLVPDYQLFES